MSAERTMADTAPRCHLCGERRWILLKGDPQVAGTWAPCLECNADGAAVPYEPREGWGGIVNSVHRRLMQLEAHRYQAECAAARAHDRGAAADHRRHAQASANELLRLREAYPDLSARVAERRYTGPVATAIQMSGEVDRG